MNRSRTCCRLSRQRQKKTGAHGSAHAQGGFTLIELMIVLVIIAIVAAFAFPSYQEYVLKSRRSTAKAALHDLAARQEQYYASNKTYTATLADLRPGAPNAIEGGHYTFSTDDAITLVTRTLTSGNVIVIGYTLQADPVGNQTKDTKCASLTLSSTGVKSATGTTPTQCW